MNHFLRKTAFLCFLILPTLLSAQTLNIINTGQTGTSGTNWSITGNTLTVTGTANIRASVVQTALTSGNLSIVGNTTNFAVTISESITATGVNTLTVGSSTNTGAINFNAVNSFAGPIYVNGGNITVSQNITCTGNGSGLTLRATGFNYINGKTLQTNNGNIIIWSDADNSQLAAGATSDEIRLSAATTLNSQGGKIVLAGGLDDGANSGTAGDNIPDNYAYRGSGANVGGVNLGPSEGAGTVVSLLSGGGDILIRGQSASSSTNPEAGVVSQTKLAINSGSGQINMLGISSVNSSGINLGGFATSNTTIAVNIAISSDYPGSGPAVRLAGAGATLGLVIGGANYVTTSNLLIQSTSSTGGGILLEGAGSSTNSKAIDLFPNGSSQLLSGTGDIIITAAAVGPVTTILGSVDPSSNVQQFGSRANSTPVQGITPTVISSNANVICRGSDVFFLSPGTVNFATTGSCTFVPLDGVNSFGTVIRTTTMDFSTVSSLTIGKPTNVNPVQINDLMNVAGPITIYGGSITVNSSINCSTGDDIVIYSNTAPTVATAQTISTSGVFKFLPQAASFSAAITYPFTNLTVTNISGLELGKTGNTANITIGTATDVNGPINIFGGVLRLNANLTTTNASTGDISLYGTSFNAAGTGNIVIANGRTATMNLSTASTYAGVISGTGSRFIKDGVGTLTLKNSQTYTGATLINGGHLQVGSDSTLSLSKLVGSINNSSGVTVAGGSNLILSPQQDTYFTIPVSGSGGIEIKGASGLYYNANPTFLTDTWVDIADAGTVLEVLTRITGGNIIGGSITTRTAGAYIKSYDAVTNTATLQMQAYNGSLTCVLFVRLQQSGTKVQISINKTPYTTGAATRTGNYLNTDMTTGATQRTLSTLSTNGYLGLKQVYMSGKVNTTGALTYTDTTTFSSTVSSLSNFYSFTSKGTMEITDASSNLPGAMANSGMLIYNRSTPLTITNNLDGSMDLLQIGAAITLTGNNIHTGTTSVDLNKTMNIGSGSSAGSLSGNITNYGSVNFNRSDAFTYPGIISGSGTVTKSGSNILTLTGANTYTGATTISGNKLVLERDIPASASSEFNGSGTLVIQPASGSFTNAVSVPISGTLNSGLGGLTIGKSGNTSNITFANATTIAGPITAYGGNIAINAALTATNADVELQATGTVTQSAAITAAGLGLYGTGTYTLTNTGNNVQTIVAGESAVRTAAISYTDASGGLTIGTVGTKLGIYSSGTVSVETLTGNLNLTQSISTNDVTSNAIILNAGKSSAIGDATGGNIIVSGTPTITTGTGGIAKLFSGSNTSSTGLTALAGGTSNERLSVDETTTTFSPTLSSNNTYALYRFGCTPTSSTETITACDSYLWHGTTYTASNNTATWTGTNAAGCDSVVTLNLTINTATFLAETQTACETYTWHGSAYKISGNYLYRYTNANGCASVDTLHLTINQPTSGGTIATAQSGASPFNPVAFTSTVAASGGTGTVEYKWQSSITSSSTGFSDIASTNADTYDAGSLSFTTWFKRLARVTCKSDWSGAVESNVIEVTVSGSSINSWTGGTNNLWNVASNWSLGTVPTLLETFIITRGTPQLNVDFTVGGNMIISGTGILTVNAGKTLSVAAGGTADFGGKSVTFKSDASGTAQLGQMLGTLSNASNVTMERYIPARRGYRLLASPVTTTTSIKYNWMENATTGSTAGYPYASGTAVNPIAAYGTQITGTGTGFDATQTGNPSLYSFVTSSQTWSVLTTTAGLFNSGDAYRMQVRGDRSIDLNTNTPTPTNTTLRVTGTPKTGNHTVTGSAAQWGWTLVGNPYQSTVDMVSVKANSTNIRDFYFVWDPTQGTRGAYVTYDLSLLTSNMVGSAVNQYLQPGQATLVQTSVAGASSILFQESDKSTATNQTATFQSAVVYPMLNVSLNYTDSLARNAAAMDGFKVAFGSSFNNAVDVNDAQKLPNLDENISILRDANYLSIEKRNLYDATTEIPMSLSNYTRLQYTLRISWSNPSDNGLIAYLKDGYTNTFTAINFSGNTDYSYTIDNSIVASKAYDRFKIVFFPNAALPVSGLTLTGEAKGNAVALQYEALNERDMQVYTIERSADGTVFTKLGEQQPVNGTAASNRYNYTDNNPLMGVNYYRIKGSSINGQLQYSNMIAVKTGRLLSTVTVAPNPIANKVLNIKLLQLTKGSYAMVITDVAGRTIYSKEMVYDGIRSEITTVLPSSLKPGNYYVRLSGEGNDFMEKFIIQ